MADDNVVDLNAPFFGDIDPEKVLDGAKGEKLKQAIVLGITPEDEVYFASSVGSRERILYLLKLCEYEIMG